MDKLDTGKLKTSAFYLSKLKDVIKNEVVKKTVYNKLVKTINATQTTDTSNLVKNAEKDRKINEIEQKINHDIFITTREFNKLTANNFDPRLKQVKLATKDDTTDIAKN